MLNPFTDREALDISQEERRSLLARVKPCPRCDRPERAVAAYCSRCGYHFDDDLTHRAIRAQKTYRGPAWREWTPVEKPSMN